MVTSDATAEGFEVLGGALLLAGASEVLGTAEVCGDAAPGVCSSHPAIKNNAAAAQAAPSGRIVMMPPVELLLTSEE
ncbi:hypothetical protein NQK81_30870 [Amycolatopsis roodepoortensis]|uniref:hypothetical protein n=1 Tax=Amycolatopsis roodepoortensis TaxID=700274 RepID=UPI00214AEFE7|nr:hypothetical protein [Amycolatopsis roodepoortensis]UUV29161.1 hypothetical protein NQK81_30870 [Amycolatopsis roodepoortensis]